MLPRGRERVRARRARVDPFTPRAVADLLGWWEAASLTDLAVGSPVAVWGDRSGCGRDASQAEGARRPTVQAGQVAGLPSVQFDGADDGLTGRSGLAADSALTLFVVAHADAAVARGRLFSLGTATPGQELGISADASGTRLAVSGVVASGERVTVATLQGWMVASLVYVPRGTLELRKNGGAALPFTTPSDGTRVNVFNGASDAPFALGATALGTQSPQRVSLATALLYGRALGDAERSQVEHWLGARYGLAVT